MFVCVCVCVCVCVRAYMYACVYIYIYIYIYMHMHVREIGVDGVGKIRWFVYLSFLYKLKHFDFVS